MQPHVSREHLGRDLPLIQGSMAGLQGSALAAAVSDAGGLGSLPCAMLDNEGMRNELSAIEAQTRKPYNVNFFCHAPPVPSPQPEARFRAALTSYYNELGIHLNASPP